MPERSNGQLPSGDGLLSTKSVVRKPSFGSELVWWRRNRRARECRVSSGSGFPGQPEGILSCPQNKGHRVLTIGVIGLGIIGGGIATNVHAAGLALVVYDVSAEAVTITSTSATVARSPADLARQSDVVVVAVVNDEQVPPY